MVIPLPDQEGRREILQIHFDALRQKGRLSQPLCQAIDGVHQVAGGDTDKSLWSRLLEFELGTSLAKNGRPDTLEPIALAWFGAPDQLHSHVCDKTMKDCCYDVVKMCCLLSRTVL
jgi:hypothetical protein